MESKSQKFVCPFCGYRAGSLEELKRHILERHTLNREDVRGITRGGFRR
ncbi:hypothetical protein JCM16138_09050 [Thermococcus atlanticus]